VSGDSADTSERHHPVSLVVTIDFHEMPTIRRIDGIGSHGQHDPRFTGVSWSGLI